MIESEEKLQEILNIVQQHNEAEYHQIVIEKKDYQVMYHMSEMRANLVSWLPIGRNQCVLELGAECGAMTGVLADKAKWVTAVDESALKTKINETRNETRSNITYITSELYDLKEINGRNYDWVMVPSAWIEQIEQIKSYLAPGGKMVIVVENRFGLKYWSGCLDKYSGKLYGSIEAHNRDQKMVYYSKKSIEKLLAQAGCGEYNFYYPYPDYQFPMIIYSDEYGPQEGELRHNLRNFDRERYMFFSELKVFNTMIEEDMFGEYANSFLVITQAEVDEEEKIVYTKYSDERGIGFQIRTDIIQNKNGKRKVRKQSLTKSGEAHLEHIYYSFHKLSEKYANQKIDINQCKKIDKDLELEYVEGQTLSQKLKQLAEDQDSKQIEVIMQEFVKMVTGGSENHLFQMTKEFKEVFGDIDMPESLRGDTNLDIDMIFANVIINDKWNLIDYEWTFEFPIPVNYVLYRAFFYESLEESDYPLFQLDQMLAMADITEKEVEVYEKMEKAFQAYTMQNIIPTRDMQQLIGKPVISVQNLQKEIADGNREIERLNHEIEKSNHEIERMNQEVTLAQNAYNNAQSEIDAIKKSKTWRLHDKLTGGH